jgi:hypothetical protein
MSLELVPNDAFNGIKLRNRFRYGHQEAARLIAVAIPMPVLHGSSPADTQTNYKNPSSEQSLTCRALAFDNNGSELRTALEMPSACMQRRKWLVQASSAAANKWQGPAPTELARLFSLTYRAQSM